MLHFRWGISVFASIRLGYLRSAGLETPALLWLSCLSQHQFPKQLYLLTSLNTCPYPSHSLPTSRALPRFNLRPKLSRNPSNILILHQLLYNRLRIMFIKRLLAGILLEEVEDMGLLGVPGETVVYHARFELRETGCLGVDGFESVGVFGVGVDGAVDAEFGVWEWWDGGEEVLSVWVGHCGFVCGWLFVGCMEGDQQRVRLLFVLLFYPKLPKVSRLEYLKIPTAGATDG